ncbi:MAG: carboxypeptidase-like regulatory domain-containing protein [Campylobacterota bacterium]|nr:carboxypeptidase-like regulatory domain-containing protein [Campylobacterota bacterium]
MFYTDFLKTSVFCALILFSSFLGAKEEIIYALSDGDLVDPTGTIHRMDGDGSNTIKVFDFSNHPKDNKALIFDLHSYDNKIYFNSDNSMFYGPSRRNIFSINTDGSGLDQITPGENSGKWDMSGSGTVVGTVKQQDGTPYSNAPVFFEGKGAINTNANGEFSFSNVASGLFWINGFASGNSTTFHSQYIHVIDNLTTTVNLIPDTTARYSHKSPIRYQDRIYYMHSLYSNTEIKYTNTEGVTPHTTLLEYGDSATECSGGVSSGEWDAFDVGKQSGKMIMLKYEEGPSCGGVYVADKDGKNLTQLVDLTSWAGEPIVNFHSIFWNNKETLFAFNSYLPNYGDEGIAIYNASGVMTSYIQANSGYALELYGWNSDDSSLLFSIYVKNSYDEKNLQKITVDNHGVADTGTITQLLPQSNIISARWKSPSKSSMPAIFYLIL